MNILAIDTTSKVAQVVCKKGDEIVQINVSGAFSEHIMGAIDEVLEKSNLDISQIDCFGIATGPGSFTGIRIGMAVVKGFLCAQSAKCVAVNSFEPIASNISDKNFVVLLDSGNVEHYYAIFDAGKATEFGHSTVEKIKAFAKQKGLKVYYSSLQSDVFGKDTDLIQVKTFQNSFLQAVLQKVEKNQFVAIQDLSPIYIKLSQAEIGLEQNMSLHSHYRPAKLTDADALAVIDEQCFAGAERYDRASFEQELLEESKHYFVALYDELVIGYVGAQVLGDDLNLVKIAVLPQYRSLGVGFKLMQMMTDFRKQNNLQKYFLEVRESNQKAIKLYQKFGFKTASVREKYYDGKENALVMFSK